MKKQLLTLPFLILLFCISAHAQDTAGKVFWRGHVDDKVHLVIRGDKIEQKTISGQEKALGIFSFTSPMPEQNVTVGFLRKAGRSKKISVVQQPNAENNFTAIVEIHDDGGGAKEYQLEIFWR